MSKRKRTDEIEVKNDRNQDWHRAYQQVVELVKNLQDLMGRAHIEESYADLFRKKECVGIVIYKLQNVVVVKNVEPKTTSKNVIVITLTVTRPTLMNQRHLFAVILVF